MSKLTKLEELVVEWCLNTLINNPEDWNSDDHWLTHAKGTRIWIGNSWWGVYISERDFRVEYGDGPDKYDHPKPSFLAMLRLVPMPEKEWRLLIWEGYQDWKQKGLDCKILDWVKSR